VALEFEGVAVQALAGPAQRGPQTLALPFDGAAATLEDAQPDVRGGVPEERQADAEEPPSSYVSGPAWPTSSWKRSLPSAVIV
jgi:hypothetical protein